MFKKLKLHVEYFFISQISLFFPKKEPKIHIFTRAGPGLPGPGPNVKARPARAQKI